MNKISGIELSEKEASVLDKSTAAQSILNRVDEAVKKAQTAAKTQNSISSDVDSDVQKGYNNKRGENNADYEQGRSEENSGGISEIAETFDPGAESQSREIGRETAGNDLRGAQSNANEGRPGERVYVIKNMLTFL